MSSSSPPFHTDIIVFSSFAQVKTTISRTYLAWTAVGVTGL
jgi:hypothetical protein